MRHLLAFAAGLTGLALGLILVCAVVGVLLHRGDLFASRITVLAATLPAAVGYAVVDWALTERDRRQRMAALNARGTMGT